MSAIKRNLLVFFVMASLCSFCFCGETHGAIDPGRTTPYQLRVVLHLGDSRLLTDVYRERLERGMQDFLQATYGPLARVEVVRNHPKLADVLDKGLQRALDDWKDRSTIKTHFVLIDYVNGHYDIQSRQHDGLTGQASPIVRSDRTRDRAFAARLAALMVGKDFGMIGSFEAWPAGPAGKRPEPPLAVTIQLQGSGLNVPLGRWVQKGDVFSLVRVPAGNREPQPIPWAFVRVQAPPRDDGSCSCQLVWRYEPPAAADTAGFRCMKIATVRGPMRLRVTEKAPRGGVATVPSVRVEVRRDNFQGPATLQGTLDSYGLFDADKPQIGEKGVFDNLALVSLYTGLTPRVRFLPVPIVDDQPVLVTVAPRSESDDLLGIRRANWKHDVADAYKLQTELFKDLQARSTEAKQREDTLKLAKEGLQRSRTDRTRLGHERTDLLKAPGAQPADAALIALEDKMLDSIKEGEGVLEKFIARQNEILAEERDPDRQKALEDVQRAKLLEEKAEYGAAIAIYKDVVKNPKTKIADVANHLQKLEKAWELKGDAHATARQFIYVTFPNLDTAVLAERIGDAEKALKTCSDAGDRLSPHRLTLAIGAHAVRLKAEERRLNPVNIDDEPKIKTIQNLLPKLIGLTNAAQEASKP